MADLGRVDDHVEQGEVDVRLEVTTELQEAVGQQPDAVPLVAQADDPLDDRGVHRELTAQQALVLVAAQGQAGCLGERHDLGLHRRRRELAALGPVPRVVIGRRLARSHQHVEHLDHRHAVPAGHLRRASVVIGRDQHAAEVEHDGADRRPASTGEHPGVDGRARGPW